MTKVEMLNEMIDNNYIDIFAYAIGSQQHNLNWFIKGKKTIETIKTEAFNNLKNHT